MIDELDTLRSMRPEVPAPPAEARAAARQQLETAIAEERQLASNRRERRRLPSLGLIAATVAGIAVAVGAIALLGHHARAGRTAPGVAGESTRVPGGIIDRAGTILASDQVWFVVRFGPAALSGSESARAAMFRRLAAVLGRRTAPVTCRLPDGRDIRIVPIGCEIEHQQATGAHELQIVNARPPAATYTVGQFRGVFIQREVVRSYPLAGEAAQALAGLENRYDTFLRAGDTLRLTLDARLQAVSQRALQQAINVGGQATGGSFVAMNPNTGAIYAMGSLPSYDPEVLSHAGLQTYRSLTSPGHNDPLLNRATQQAGPVGATIEPITALAALQSRAWRGPQTYDDTGQFCVGSAGSQQCRHNSGRAAYGVLTLTEAIKVASNNFFANLGALTNADPATHPDGGALDQWARGFGLGRLTGVDLPNETAGTLPTPQWRAERNRLEAECDAGTGPYAGKGKHPPGGCGIADGTNRPWSIGDNINLAEGQGDVQATPLQLAVAYAAIANGGTVVRPHLGQAILSLPGGDVLQQIEPAAGRHLNLNRSDLAAVELGLHEATSRPGGTTADVFAGFPDPVYGQVGTALTITSRGSEQRTALFAGYVPASATSRPIVVVVRVDGGGFGAVAAAPAARQILSQWVTGRPGPWRPGTSTAG
jgi:penicillin-binding protein 2